MLHSHHALAGDLYAAVILPTVLRRGWPVSAWQNPSIRESLRLEQRGLPRPHGSRILRTLNTSASLTYHTLTAGLPRSISHTRREHTSRGLPPALSQSDSGCRYATNVLPTRQQTRSVSQKIPGPQLSLPKNTPSRNTAPPPPVGPSRSKPRGVLRTTTSSSPGLQYLGSPDDERQKQEDERKKQAEIAQQQIKQEAKQEAKQEKERWLAEQLIAKRGRERLAVLSRLDCELDTLRHQIPSSRFALRYLVTVTFRFNAQRAWHRLYSEQVERPVDSFKLQLARIETFLHNFRALVRLTLPHARSQAKLEWRLSRIHALDQKAETVLAETAVVRRDLKLYENSVRALQKAVLSLARETLGGIQYSKQQGVHDRLKTIASIYQNSVVATAECLSDSNLLRMKAELVQRRKWSPGAPGPPIPRQLWEKPTLMIRHAARAGSFDLPEEWHRQMDSKVFLGALSFSTLDAFFALYSARAMIAEAEASISLTLHTWRENDVTRGTLDVIPPLATHLVAFSRVDTPMSAIMHSRWFMGTDLRILGVLLFCNGVHVGLNSRWERMNTIIRMLSDGFEDANRLLHETFNHGLSVLMLTPTSVIERSSIAIYRPFSVNHSLAHEVVYRGEVLTKLWRAEDNLSTSTNRLRSAIIRDLTDLQLTLSQLVGLKKAACSWSMASDLYYGRFYRQRPMTMVAPSYRVEKSIALPSAQSSSAPTTLANTRFGISQNPQVAAVPVDYLHDTGDLFTALRELRFVETLALDLVVSHQVDHLKIVTHRIEYILIASEGKVIVFRARALYGPRASMQILCDLLEDPAIIKVGVNTLLTRQMLAREVNAYLQSWIDLDGDSASVFREQLQWDANHSVLDRLGSRCLGRGLPKPPSWKSLLEDGGATPLRHFEYLASRAYLPLQLYHSMGSKSISRQSVYDQDAERYASMNKVSATAISPSSDGAQFGPIRVGARWSVRMSTQEGELGKLNRTSRADYLHRISRKLSLSAVEKAGMRPTLLLVKYLQAYYLAKVFGEPLASVSNVIRISNRDTVYDGMISAAQKLGLYLHKEHQALREEQVFSAGMKGVLGIGRRQKAPARPVTALTAGIEARQSPSTASLRPKTPTRPPRKC
jgi:hypothetical protein